MMNDLLSAPLTLNWTLSFRCNFSCSHCWSRDEAAPELDLKQLRAIVDVLAAHRIPFINFGGGEPLIREELFELCSYAVSRGLRVSMNSNGWHLDRTMARRIRQAGFSSVGISIDSPDSGVHDRFRSMPGSFERASNALGHLRDAGIKRTMSSVICTINHQELHGLIALARTYEVSALYLHNFKCSGEGMKNRAELDLSAEQWRSFYQHAIAIRQDLKGLNLTFDDPVIASLPGYAEQGMVKGSSCGKLSLHLRPNGDLTPCGFIPLVIGNILEEDFSRLWHDSPILNQMRNKVPTGQCASCASYEDCLGGCSARAFAESGDFNSPDPHCWK